MGIWFLDLGRQPLANGFLTEEQFKDEFFYNLRICFDPATCLVSLNNFVPPEKMFNKDYAYTSSCSDAMKKHFEKIAKRIKINPHPYMLEIGSNDGVFLKHFNQYYTTAIEPCANFANITSDKGYKTYNNFWTMELSHQIVKERGRQDVVYSANCMCHIQNIQEAFDTVYNVLKPSGTFVFEDPSMLDVIKNISYDQFYDEHAHLFSVIALQRLLQKSKLYINKVEHLNTHGGSNRLWCSKYNRPDESVQQALDIEYGYGLDQLDRYFRFAEEIKKSKEQLVELVSNIRKMFQHIVGYGATSKSTVVYNYCGFGPNEIDYIIDTTLVKQGKFSPGTHIPIIAPKEIDEEYAFLGAWNYKDEIIVKEKKRKFRFITHVPRITII